MRCLIILLAGLFSLLTAAIPIRIGDVGSVPDPSRFDPRFPEMEGFALAGVEGGVPHIERIVGEVAAGQDLAAAIKAADVGPGNLGVLLLGAGEFSIPGSIKVKSGLILRGQGPEQTFLISELNEMKATHGVMETHAVHLSTWSALEDLTVRNRHVHALDPATYDHKYDNPGAPCSNLVAISGRTSNAWIQRCHLTHAGSNPLSISARHVTIRDCTIDRAHNKGGKGHGYLEVGQSHHVLFYNCTITNIRHLSIMWKSTFIVVLHCSMNVDINYHDGLPEKCLVEKTTIKRGKKHHWAPICYGWAPWQEVGPGPRCLLWDNTFDGKGGGNTNVQVLRDTTPGYANMKEKKPMILDAGAPPQHGTLYAVTGKHIPYEQVAKGRCMENLAKAQQAKNPVDTLFYANLAKGLFAADSQEVATADAAIAQVESDAKAALAKLGSKAKGPKLAEFCASWPDTAAATEARQRAADLAKAAWAKVAKGSKDPTPSKVRGFVDDWHGLTDIGYAMTWYNTYAKESYDRAKDRLDKADDAGEFVERWPHADITTQAKARWIKALTANLASLKARVKDMRKRDLQSALKPFIGTPLEEEARSVLSPK